MNRPFAERLAAVVEAITGKRPPLEVIIERAIENHFVDGAVAPEWMLTLLDRLLKGEATPSRIPYPPGYPDGENGLTNVLADLERFIAPLGIDDEGERLEWPLPTLGVLLHLEREGGDYYLVRPWSGPWSEKSPYGERRGTLVAGRFEGVVEDFDPAGGSLRTLTLPAKVR